MDLDPVLLARLQFAFTISFHIIFPSFTIGLSAYIATLLRALARDRPASTSSGWRGSGRKIFAVSFAMGVVSGIVLSYQFGTNWSRFSVVAGNVIGPLIGYEVLTAFFLEATFLGIMLFGGNRVPPLAACALGDRRRDRHRDLGVLDPVGQQLDADAGRPRDARRHRRIRSTGWAIIFNPSFPYRLAHMLNAAYLTAGFVVLAVGARYLLAGRHRREAAPCCAWRSGCWPCWRRCSSSSATSTGSTRSKHQPIKIAAMEAHWDGSKPGDFHIFAWPDEKAETNRFAISIPRGASLDPHASISTACSRAQERAAAERPPVVTVFFAFRIMLAIGLLHDRGGAYRRRGCGGAAGCSRRAGICARRAHLVDSASWR